MWNIGDYAYSTDLHQLCQVIEAQTLWGETLCRVWLPNQDTVVRVRADRLKPLQDAGTNSCDGITYVAAAARVADALTHDVLLAPIGASVIPLPHQLQALSRAIANDRVRYLLADEVGLGKTIEAGLIMRELKLRGAVQRTLVVAPRGLVTQWVAEMHTHFGETFQLLAPSDFAMYRRMAQEENIWRAFPQVVCPLDSVKPLDSRRGWSRAQVAGYNRERFEDLIAARWDLVIVDEAHRLGGSTDQVARYKLGQSLAEAAPYCLLLSATPHQGKTDAFHRLIALLDTQAFPDILSVTRERVQPYVIRTEKRRAIDTEGQPLFKPRRTQLVPVAWQDRHREQRRLYDAVTEYVREGYNQAIREKRSYIGFLMLLMQRLVVSSTRAIRVTLERRLEALAAPEEQLSLFPAYAEDEWADLDGQEQLDTLLTSRLKALRNERAEVRLLLEAARRCEEIGLDAKAEALLDWLYRLQQEEGDPDMKVLVFTEFVPTQEMLAQFLGDRGFSVVCLNGSMAMDERQRVQKTFSQEARILISTDAGGEGLNLQFCHVVINYDIPWNPMRLEQRIGRVDRIGQTHVVRAANFVCEDSVEYRVREVLEEKLAIILDEFGIDKTGDVLDSAQAGQMFDDLYVEVILHPEAIASSIENVVSRVQTQAQDVRASASVLGPAPELDPAEVQRLLTHPLPYWIETMTTAYLRNARDEGRGATVVQQAGSPVVWQLRWPDGTVQEGSFMHAGAGIPHLGLEEPRIRGLTMRLPRFVQGQPLPILALPDLPPDVRGVWSLWQIAIHTDDWHQRRIMPLFLHDDDRLLLPTARRIWDELLSAAVVIRGYLEGDEARRIFDRLMEAAEAHGKPIYTELLALHRERLTREQDKGEYAFAARRRTVEWIGLPAVRYHRLAQLEREEQTWHEQIKRQAEVSPDLVPLLLLCLEGGTSGG